MSEIKTWQERAIENGYKGQPPLNVAFSYALDEIAELRAAQQPAPDAQAPSEADDIAVLNQSQWLALENIRTLAARNRKEEWAQSVLRFCTEAGNGHNILRKRQAAPAGDALDAKRYRYARDNLAAGEISTAFDGCFDTDVWIDEHMREKGQP